MQDNVNLQAGETVAGAGFRVDPVKQKGSSVKMTYTRKVILTCRVSITSMTYTASSLFLPVSSLSVARPDSNGAVSVARRMTRRAWLYSGDAMQGTATVTVNAGAAQADYPICPPCSSRRSSCMRWSPWQSVGARAYSVYSIY